MSALDPTPPPSQTDRHLLFVERISLMMIMMNRCAGHLCACVGVMCQHDLRDPNFRPWLSGLYVSVVVQIRLLVSLAVQKIRIPSSPKDGWFLQCFTWDGLGRRVALKVFFSFRGRYAYPFKFRNIESSFHVFELPTVARTIYLASVRINRSLNAILGVSRITS